MASAGPPSSEGHLSPFLFPAELEQYIFELAYEHHPEIGYTLMCVSRYVSAWIERFVYEIIIVRVSHRREPSIETVRKHGRHARHLLIGINVEEDRIVEYLRACPNLINFASWALHKLNEECLQMLKTLPLVRLSFHFRSICYDSDVGVPGSEQLWADEEYTEAYKRLEPLLVSLPTLTHLDLASRSPSGVYQHLHLLPNLKYLSVFNTDFEGWLAQLFQACPDMKAVVVLGEDALSTVPQLKGVDRDDERVLHVDVPDYVRDWELGARGETDVWMFAEKFIEKRRLGIAGHVNLIS